MSGFMKTADGGSMFMMDRYSLTGMNVKRDKGKFTFKNQKQETA
jgi:hypothetical protein